MADEVRQQLPCRPSRKRRQSIVQLTESSHVPAFVLVYLHVIIHFILTTSSSSFETGFGLLRYWLRAAARGFALDDVGLVLPRACGGLLMTI